MFWPEPFSVFCLLKSPFAVWLLSLKVKVREQLTAVAAEKGEQ